MFPFCILQCISFLGKFLIVRGRRKVQNGLHSIPYSLSGACSAIGNVSPCIILFIASLVIPIFLHAHVSGFYFAKEFAECVEV